MTVRAGTSRAPNASSGDGVARLRIDRLERGKAADPVMFSRTRHISFAQPDGRLKIESASVGSRGVRLFAVSSTGHEVALAEETHVNVILPLRGMVSVATHAADFTATPGTLLVFPPNERRTVVKPDRGLYEALVLAVPLTALGDGGVAAFSAARLGPTETSGALARDLTDLIACLRSGIPTFEADDGFALVAARLEDRLRDALPDLASHRPGLNARAGSLRQLRSADDFLRLNIGRPLRMADVAAAAGLSIRGLQASFSRHRGMTPCQALSRLRLEEARIKLLTSRPEDRVTDVALLMGFTHLGRFSQSYAQRFGESPSTTLRRAQSG